jgi:uncharacterized coiled-coil protein SlyX
MGEPEETPDEKPTKSAEVKVWIALIAAIPSLITSIVAAWQTVETQRASQRASVERKVELDKTYELLNPAITENRRYIIEHTKHVAVLLTRMGQLEKENNRLRSLAGDLEKLARRRFNFKPSKPKPEPAADVGSVHLHVHTASAALICEPDDPLCSVDSDSDGIPDEEKKPAKLDFPTAPPKPSSDEIDVAQKKAKW